MTTIWPDPEAPRNVVDAFVASLPPVRYCAQCGVEVESPAPSRCPIPDNHGRSPAPFIVDPRSGKAIPCPFGLADLGGGAVVPHEAPQVENGPSVMCAACGLVRIGILGPPFCKTCRACLAAAGVAPEGAEA